MKNSTHNSIEFLGMGNGQTGHGEEITCLAYALCPKRRAKQPRPPTIRLSFPSLSINKVTAGNVWWLSATHWDLHGASPQVPTPIYWFTPYCT